MKEFPDWMITAIRKRMEALDNQLQTNPQHKSERQETLRYFEKWKESLSEEQFRMFLEWEERINFLISEEKEKLYIYGLIDGFHVHASFIDNEISPSQRFACQRTQNYASTPEMRRWRRHSSGKV